MKVCGPQTQSKRSWLKTPETGIIRSSNWKYTVVLPKLQVLLTENIRSLIYDIIRSLSICFNIRPCGKYIRFLYSRKFILTARPGVIPRYTNVKCCSSIQRERHLVWYRFTYKVYIVITLSPKHCNSSEEIEIDIVFNCTNDTIPISIYYFSGKMSVGSMILEIPSVFYKCAM